MTVAEAVMQHVEALPELVQTEILDFVEFIELKRGRTESENSRWSSLSLSRQCEVWKMRSPPTHSVISRNALHDSRRANWSSFASRKQISQRGSCAQHWSFVNYRVCTTTG